MPNNKLRQTGRMVYRAAGGREFDNPGLVGQLRSLLKSGGSEKLKLCMHKQM